MKEPDTSDNGSSKKTQKRMESRTYTSGMRAMGVYRFLLWILPAFIALSTLVTGNWLSGQISGSGGWIALCWLVFNGTAIAGLGIFDGHLRRHREGRPLSPKHHAIVFFAFQALVMPAILLALGWVAAWCLLYFYM
jgi:hypothetical protein